MVTYADICGEIILYNGWKQAWWVSSPQIKSVIEMYDGIHYLMAWQGLSRFLVTFHQFTYKSFKREKNDEENYKPSEFRSHTGN